MNGFHDQYDIAKLIESLPADRIVSITLHSWSKLISHVLYETQYFSLRHISIKELNRFDEISELFLHSEMRIEATRTAQGFIEANDIPMLCKLRAFKVYYDWSWDPETHEMGFRVWEALEATVLFLRYMKQRDVRSIKVMGTRNVDLAVFECIAECCPKLRWLELNVYPDDAGGMLLLFNNTCIEHFTCLDTAAAATPLSAAVVASLKTIKLGFCDKVDFTIFQACHQLESFTAAVTSASMVHTALLSVLPCATLKLVQLSRSPCPGEGEKWFELNRVTHSLTIESTVFSIMPSPAAVPIHTLLLAEEIRTLVIMEPYDYHPNATVSFKRK